MKRHALMGSLIGTAAIGTLVVLLLPFAQPLTGTMPMPDGGYGPSTMMGGGYGMGPGMMGQ